MVEACARTLAQALHRRGVDHGDLKASHIYVRAEAEGIETHGSWTWTACASAASLDDERRLRALAQLNASLPDRFPDAARHSAFRRYAGALPFQLWNARSALQQVVTRSLARTITAGAAHTAQTLHPETQLILH